MADYLPQATGDWTTTTWITAFGGLSAFAGGNTPPTVIDDVYADGKTITVNINTAVLSLRTTTSPRTGGLAGGSFTFTNGITLTANALAGTTTCLLFTLNAPNSSTLVGSVTGSASTTSANGITHSGTGTLNVFGNIMAGAGANGPIGLAITTSTGGITNIIGSVFGRPGTGTNCDGISYSSSAVVNITGNVVAGSGNTNLGVRINAVGATVNVLGNVFGGGGSCSGISTNNTVTINVTGNVFGSDTQASGYGIINGGIGTTTVFGNVSGGAAAEALRNSSTGSIFCYGSSTGGTGSGIVGTNNVSTGFVYATKAVGNGFGLGSVGIGGVAVGLANSQNGRAYVEQAEFGVRGATPISGPVYILPSNRNTLVGYTTALGTPVTFYNSLSVNGLLPPVSSVQAGVVYNVGNSVGTMAVPSASAVQFGVPVDNTIGTAALQPQDVWGYARLSATQVDSMGDRLRNTATTQSIGYQIASFNL